MPIARRLPNPSLSLTVCPVFLLPCSAHDPQILEHCREVYADRQARAGGEEAGGGAAQAAAAAQTAAQAKGGKAPTAREVAFRAAVNAARRRGGGALSSPSKPGLTPG